MKRIILLISLLIAFSMNAQVQTIYNQLKLNNVQQGTAVDSVLVRGADGIIKYVKKSDLLSDVVPTLTTQLLDTYNGTRLVPFDNSLNGFHIQKSTNTNIGFSVFNDDNVGNGAQANVTVKGPGPLYTNNSGISHYGGGYGYTWLRNSGLFYSDSPLYMATWNNNDINFMTGATFPSLTSKFKIGSTGQLAIGVAPTVENTATSLLARNASGNIVSVDKSTITPVVTLQQVLNNDNSADANSGNISTIRLLSTGSNTINTINSGGFGISEPFSGSTANFNTNGVAVNNVDGRTASFTYEDGLKLRNVVEEGGVANLKSDLVTSNRTLQFPDESGTLATQTYSDNNNLLQNFTIDSYNGTRLAPKNSTSNGYFVNKAVNQNVGFYAQNSDDSGNAAQASLTVKGSGALYTNYIGMSYYNSNYYVSALRNTGTIFSDRPMNFLTWGTSAIDFRTGGAFTSTTSKLKINSTGQLNIGVAPTTDNTVTNLLGRDASGNVVSVTKSTIAPTPTLQAVADAGDTYDTNTADVYEGIDITNSNYPTLLTTLASGVLKVSASGTTSDATLDYLGLSVNTSAGAVSALNTTDGLYLKANTALGVGKLSANNVPGGNTITLEFPADEIGNKTVATRDWVTNSAPKTTLQEAVIASSSDLTITDARTTKTGLEYAADYSADFTDRSLVDKAYVDASAGGSTPNLDAVTTEGNFTNNKIQAKEFRAYPDPLILNSSDSLFVANSRFLTLGDVGQDYSGNGTRYLSVFDPNYNGDETFEIYTSNTNQDYGDIYVEPNYVSIGSGIYSSGGTIRSNSEVFLEDGNLTLSSIQSNGLNAKVNEIIMDPDQIQINGTTIMTGKNGIDGDPSTPDPVLHVIGGNGGNSVLTTGVVVGGNSAEIKIEGGNGGNALTSSDTNIAGKGGDVYFIAGDGGLATGPGTNLPGNGGMATVQAGETWGGLAGNAAIKAGNGNLVGDYGGNVYIVPGFGNELDDSDTSLYNGTVFLDVSPNMTSVRGNTVIGNLTDDRINRLQVTGTAKFSSSVQVGDNINTATVDNVGAIRYRADGSNSYCEMVMQTGASTYAWVIIKQNTF